LCWSREVPGSAGACDAAGRLWPCLGTQLRLRTSHACQAALAPAHLRLSAALKSWLSSLQHTFETEIALCFYTYTYSTSTSLTKINNIKEFTLTHPFNIRARFPTAAKNWLQGDVSLEPKGLLTSDDQLPYSAFVTLNNYEVTLKFCLHFSNRLSF